MSTVLSNQTQDVRQALINSGMPLELCEQIASTSIPSQTKKELYAKIVANSPCGIFTDAVGHPNAIDLGHIDKGGMAAVRMGWHIQQQRFVAIKVSFIASDDAPSQTPIQPTTDKLVDKSNASDTTDAEYQLDDATIDQATSAYAKPPTPTGLDVTHAAKPSEFTVNQNKESTSHSSLERDLLSFTHGRPTIGIDVRFEREIAAYEQMPDMGFVDKGWFGQHKVLMMEYLEGAVSLKHILNNSEQPFSFDVTRSITVLLCKLLSKIHRHRIGHRDIKPGNILLNGKGQLQIIDFGLAKNYGVDLDANNRRKAITHMAAGARRSYEATEDAGGIVGTPIFMPPEQVGTAVNEEARDIFHAVLRLRRDERQDIYSLGATLFNLATGEQLLAPTRYARLIESDFGETARTGQTGLPCLLYTSPSPRDRTRSRMPSSA